jgi:cysteinyl-tRNA synthetase
MNDDFNTPQALSVMFDILRAANAASKSDVMLAHLLMSQLKRMANILGILQADPTSFLQGTSSEGGLSAEAIEAYIVERKDAKLAKNYARADEVRQLLIESKIIVEDFPTGTTWRRE